MANALDGGGAQVETAGRLVLEASPRWLSRQARAGTGVPGVA